MISETEGGHAILLSEMAYTESICFRVSLSYSPVMPATSKREIIAMVSEKCSISSAEAARAVETVMGVIFQQLAQGNTVALRGVGTFQLRKAKAKLGRNPSNPMEIKVIPERWVVRFRPAGAMRDALCEVPFDDPATP